MVYGFRVSGLGLGSLSLAQRKKRDAAKGRLGAELAIRSWVLVKGGFRVEG